MLNNCIGNIFPPEKGNAIVMRISQVDSRPEVADRIRIMVFQLAAGELSEIPGMRV